MSSDNSQFGNSCARGGGGVVNVMSLSQRINTQAIRPPTPAGVPACRRARSSNQLLVVEMRDGNPPPPVPRPRPRVTTPGRETGRQHTAVERPKDSHNQSKGKGKGKGKGEREKGKKRGGAVVAGCGGGGGSHPPQRTTKRNSTQIAAT